MIISFIITIKIKIKMIINYFNCYQNQQNKNY